VRGQITILTSKFSSYPFRSAQRGLEDGGGTENNQKEAGRHVSGEWGTGRGADHNTNIHFFFLSVSLGA